MTLLSDYVVLVCLIILGAMAFLLLSQLNKSHRTEVTTILDSVTNYHSMMSSVLESQNKIIQSQNNLILSKDPMVYQVLQASTEVPSSAGFESVSMSDAAEAIRYAHANGGLVGFGDELYDTDGATAIARLYESAGSFGTDESDDPRG